MWHPNIYEVSPRAGRSPLPGSWKGTALPAGSAVALTPLSVPAQTGDVCISILHPPVDDPQSGELPSERWNPTQNVR